MFNFNFIYLLKNKIHDGGSDGEDQRWNNSSDDDNDGGGVEYSWKRINEKNNSTKQTKGKLYILHLVNITFIVNKNLINK